MKRTYNTLFLIESLDGKISTGSTDNMDVDKDYPNIPNVKAGVKQYYDLEQQMDKVSLNTGRVMAKIGVNERDLNPNKIDVDFVIIDNKPHLTKQGVSYISKWVRNFYLVTTNESHPAFSFKEELQNLNILQFDDGLDLAMLFNRLFEEFGVERVTIQSGGTLNSKLVREGLIDEVSIVIAPLLVGGKNTPTLIDGASLTSTQELGNIKPLELIENKTLNNSFIHLRYKVLN